MLNPLTVFVPINSDSHFLHQQEKLRTQLKMFRNVVCDWLIYNRVIICEVVQWSDWPG